MLLGLALLGGGVARTLLDEMVGIVLLAVGRFWFGTLMGTDASPTGGGLRR